MPVPIDQQIEALVEAHDREMARLHLGCSPYDEDPDDDTWTDGREAEGACLEIRRPKRSAGSNPAPSAKGHGSTIAQRLS